MEHPPPGASPSYVEDTKGYNDEKLRNVNSTRAGDVETADFPPGGQAKLSRNLQGRHMQMIAIGELNLMPAFLTSV